MGLTIGGQPIGEGGRQPEPAWRDYESSAPSLESLSTPTAEDRLPWEEDPEMYGCEGCGVSRPKGQRCPVPQCPTNVQASAPPRRSPASSATPRFYRQTTPLVEEVDALTGYDSGGLFAAFEAAIQARHDAKRRVSHTRAVMVALAARFEAKGTATTQADREHKMRVAQLAQQVREEYYRSPEMVEEQPKFKGGDPLRKVIRLTAEEIDQRVRASEEYRKFLDEQGRLRLDWEEAKRDHDEAWADYEQQAGIVQYLESQLEDRKSMIYYASKEWRHRDATSGA